MFAGYDLVLAPGLMHMPQDLKAALAAHRGQVLVGPRSAARDQDFKIEVPLPPALPGLDVTVDRLESLRPDSPVVFEGGGSFQLYREQLMGTAEVSLKTEDGLPVTMGNGQMTYLAGWPDAEGWRRVLLPLCQSAGLAVADLPAGLRLRDSGSERFWFNYGAETASYGGKTYAPASVTRESRRD